MHICIRKNEIPESHIDIRRGSCTCQSFFFVDGAKLKEFATANMGGETRFGCRVSVAGYLYLKPYLKLKRRTDWTLGPKNTAFAYIIHRITKIVTKTKEILYWFPWLLVAFIPLTVCWTAQLPLSSVPLFSCILRLISTQDTHTITNTTSDAPNTTTEKMGCVQSTGIDDEAKARLYPPLLTVL